MANRRAPDAEIQGFYCPLQPAALVVKRLANGKCQLTDLGLEKRCAKCTEYWPMDTEYWFGSATPDGLHSWCRACYTVARWPDGRPSTRATPELAAG